MIMKVIFKYCLVGFVLILGCKEYNKELKRFGVYSEETFDKLTKEDFIYSKTSKNGILSPRIHDAPNIYGVEMETNCSGIELRFDFSYESIDRNHRFGFEFEDSQDSTVMLVRFDIEKSIGNNLVIKLSPNLNQEILEKMRTYKLKRIHHKGNGKAHGFIGILSGMSDLIHKCYTFHFAHFKNCKNL